jgi:hypothetical protein
MKSKTIFATVSDTSKLPKTRKELDKMWDAGAVPERVRLLGSQGEPARYLVTMASGIIPNMGRWPLWHHKKFRSVGGFVRGCNAFALGDAKWGDFRLEEMIGSLLINYDVPTNGWFSRRIRDHIRATDDPNVMIGKFHFKIFGRECFLGYFFLTRLKEETPVVA